MFHASFIIKHNGLAMKCGRFSECFSFHRKEKCERKAHISTEYELPYFMSRC